MTRKGIYRKSDNLVCRKIAGETILVPVRDRLADMQRIFSLNATAEFIWNELDGRKDIEGIRDSMVASFQVEPGDADSDIEDFVGSLLEAGLIERVA